MFTFARRTLTGLLTLATMAAAPTLASTPQPFPTDGPRFNTKTALTWNQFKGKVVVIDFWNHH